MTALTKPTHTFKQNKHNDLPFCKCGIAKHLHDNPTTMTLIEKLKEGARRKMNFTENSNRYHCTPQVLDTLIESIAHQVAEYTLRNVPVGFVRQWINEDLLKDGHRLVTNEDIQSFINIALTPPTPLQDDKTDV